MGGDWRLGTFLNSQAQGLHKFVSYSHGPPFGLETVSRLGSGHTDFGTCAVQTPKYGFSENEQLFWNLTFGQCFLDIFVLEKN